MLQSPFSLIKSFLAVLFIFPFFAFSQTTFQQAETYFQQEKYSKAKSLFENYLQDYPNDRKTKEYLGDIAGHAKDWDTAIEYYEELVEANSRSANYHFKYGGAMGMKALEISKIRALTYIGDIKQEFEIAAQLDPKHIDVRWALVEFYIQLPSIVGGSESKAIHYANELEKISPVDGQLAKGYIAEYSDRPNDAERYYIKAIEIGGSPTTYDKLTSHYEKNNKPKEAIATASQSLKVHQRNPLNYQIGKIAAQYNLEASLGIKCLNAYINNYTSKDGVPKGWAYLRLAQIYKNEGDKQLAMQWIDKALQTRPDFKEAKNEKSLIQNL